MQERKYNFIYQRLIESNDDLVGLVAYGLYKRHKIEFITKIKEKEERDPSDEECNAFFISSTTDSQIAKYRADAESLVSEMVMNVTGEEIQQYEKEMLRDYQNKIKEVLPSNTKSVFLSIAGAFAFSIIAGLFYFIGGTSEKVTQENTLKVLELLQQKIQTTDTIIQPNDTIK